MEKEFVPYELALRLKTLGFDEPCFAFYQEEYTEIKPTMVDDDDEYRLTGYRTCKNTEIPEHYTAAPTFSQSFKWFREKHKLSCNVIIGEKNFGFKIQYLSDFTNNWYAGYSSYEEAELACLEKLIEIVESETK